jgi:hypothetical protein
MIQMISTQVDFNPGSIQMISKQINYKISYH